MSKLLKDLDNLTLLLGDFYPKTTFLCKFYVAKGPLHYTKFTSLFFNMGLTPLSPDGGSPNETIQYNTIQFDAE